jgi:hypothetical protein
MLSPDPDVIGGVFFAGLVFERVLEMAQPGLAVADEL